MTTLLSNIKFVVILHEFSQRSLKAKLATLFLFFFYEIIFTTDFERNYSKKLFPFISKRFHTIKILSNIKAVKDLHKWEDRKYDLMYFGHIRPSKGLEDVFQVVLDLQRAKTVKVAIVGQVY